MTEEFPIKWIIKRHGDTAPFNAEKITDAVYKSVQAAGSKDRSIAEQACHKVLDILKITYKGNRIPTVEEVQDLVEFQLIELNQKEIAKKYILYRHQHEQIRSTRKMFDDALEMIDDYLDKDDWRIKENSNMSFSLQGLNNHIASKISSQYWLEKIYDDKIRDLHKSGAFHLHDLGLISVYCCGWDLRELLINGFRGAFGKVESSPAKHFRSALGQIVNFFYTMQGESAGAQAFANFDTLLAPFIAMDKLTYAQVKQSMQEFVFNMNIPTRVGFQTPFTNITMDLVCPSYYANENIIIGGLPHDCGAVYSEFQDEMDMVNRAYCEVMMEGDARGRIFTFPIPTYNITKEFDWDNRNLDSLWEMTARYGVPYFSNFINSDMDPEDARSMCCRLRLDNRQLRALGMVSETEEVEKQKKSLKKRGGGLFGANPLTGSIGVVTLNMPRVGFESDDEQQWFSRIDELMEKAKDSLEVKRGVLEDFTNDGLYPYSKYYLSGVKMRKRKDSRDPGYWDNHFSTIGLIGMNEGLINFFGQDIASEQGVDLARRTLDHMNDKLIEFQQSTGNLFNLEATPGEGTTYRLAKNDKKNFENIFTQGKEEPYYTNSTHLPVEYTEDLFQALVHQDQLQTMYTGGTVLHGFIGEKIGDIESCKALVRKIAENFHLPYYTITPTFSICPEHGYLPGEHFTCPFENGATHEPIQLDRS